MAVFYLQQTDPPLVPSIESLQSEVPQEEKIHFNGWNISFQVPLDTGKPPTQAASEMAIIDLLIGFFRFYKKLNAIEVVVCPRIGKCLLKTEFVDAPHSPEARSTFLGNDKQDDLRPPLKLSLLFVQDPFELNFNVSFNFRHFELFQSLCESAERTCLRIVDVEKNDKQSVLPALFKVPIKTKFASKAKRNHIQSSVLLELELAILQNVKNMFSLLASSLLHY
jgi:speckle targeted PIP5K1A-regulated poly(A) polymerase